MDDTEQRLAAIETQLRLDWWPGADDTAWLVSQLREARKDAERYAFLRAHYFAADFRDEQRPEGVTLKIGVDRLVTVSSDFGATVDRAMEFPATEQQHSGK